MIKKCLGCGATFQSEKPEMAGYINASIYGKTKICRRCFRIKNYGDYVFIKKDSEDYQKMLSHINYTNDLVVYVVDLFNIGQKIEKVDDFLKNPFILVLNKRDLLPKTLTEIDIINWLKPYNLNYLKLICISSHEHYQLDKLYELINYYKKSNNVYVVGNTNAGKSTLINTLTKNYAHQESDITISMLPSTTFEMMEIKLNDDLTLIDTPGLLDGGSIENVVDFMKLKTIIPVNEIQPRIYQVQANQSLIIDDLVRIDYLEGNKNILVIYVANGIKIEQVNLNHDIRLRKLKEINFNIEGNEDVVISGLGWIKIINQAKIRVYALDNVNIFKRHALV